MIHTPHTRSRRLPLRGVADSGEARCALSIRPLLGCAGHFLPSDLRRPARSCKQVRRVVDPSSQLHAPRRIRCTRWPDEGSALEMAHSDDDRSHSKGHDRSSRRSRTLQRPCDRLAAEHWQLGALVTGHAPCPVTSAPSCTSVAQLPVTVTRQCSRGRPRTCRSPQVSRYAEYTRSTATGCKRTPCGAVTSIRSHDVQMVPHAHATGGGSPGLRQPPPLRSHITCA